MTYGVHDMKVCSKCNVEKDESEFRKKSSSKDGLCARCKSCCKEEDKIYHEKNKEKSKEKSKIWRKNNIDKAKNNLSEWEKINTKKRKEYRKKYSAKRIAEINDSYIKQLISRCNFSHNLIPQSLVDFHREVIRSKRLLKELQK